MSAWRAEAETLALVSQGAELPGLVAEAASWAERITLCVTAPRSQRGALPWWRELLARNSKCDGVYVRQGERAEGWLLHRLHAAGVLQLVDVDVEGGQVAAQLLMFARAGELRAVLAHVPLERAVAGAAFGSLLSFRGQLGGELGRACQAQAERWAELARIPTGREVDVIGLDPRRRERPAPLDVPGSLRVVSEPAALAAALARFDLAPSASAARGSLDAARLQPIAGGYRLLPAHGSEARFPLTLFAGAYWAAGNALLLDDEASGQSVLVWRGDLLGPARSRSELLWSEARLTSFCLEDAARGLSRRVAVVARSGEPLARQLVAFMRELARASDTFGIEPPPALGHVLADFTTLSAKQQTLLVWRALIGSGPLELDAAASIAVESLRAQGFLHEGDSSTDAVRGRAVRELLVHAAGQGRSFDRPSPERVRAVLPDASAFAPEDWLECLLLGVPEHAVVAHRTALRLALEHARGHFGLGGAQLERDGDLERALEAAVADALCRGLLVRVGAAGLQRLTSASDTPEVPRDALASNASQLGFVTGWARALAELDPVRRLLLARRAGWYGRSETTESVALRLGLPLERARQLEADAWRRVELGSGWARALRARLERALAAARSVPLRQLVLDDAWWHGVEQHLELADAVLDRLLKAEIQCVGLASPARDLFFARFTQAELDGALERLIARAADADPSARSDGYRALCDEACRELEPSLAEYLGDALEVWLVRDLDDPSQVLGVAAPAGATFERSPPDALELGAAASLELEEALLGVFRGTGTPLSLSGVMERLRPRLDVTESSVAARLLVAPFVRRNPDQYGLLARDVPGGHEAIAAVLGDLTEALDSSQRPLDAEASWAIVQGRVRDAWSPELVHCLIDADPELCASPARGLTLRRWRRGAQAHGDEQLPGIPAGARARFNQLVQQAPLEPGALARRLASEVARLERSGDSDELRALPVARQLGDVCVRLLEHEVSQPSVHAAWIQAAIQTFLDAVSPDAASPDAADGDAELIDRERLSNARASIAAVLHGLGLPWLSAAGLRRPL